MIKAAGWASRVEFEPKLVVDEALIAAKIDELRQSDPGLAAVYDILARRYDDGRPGNVLETHNDHQP